MRNNSEFRVLHSAFDICPCSSVVEHFLGKEGVTGSIPVVGLKGANVAFALIASHPQKGVAPKRSEDANARFNSITVFRL